MKSYTHIFFDLDETLWDFRKNSNQALTDLFDEYELEGKGVHLPDFLNMFHTVNDRLWKQYSYGRIDKEFLRSKRFKLIFRELGCYFDDSVRFGHEYLSICPYNSHLIEGSVEILEYLYPKYPLHVITNGFEEIAQIKLRSGGLEKYFDKIVTSEKAGFKKPSDKIFEYALKACSTRAEDAIMIGNDPEADIQGSKNAGMDQLFFNPKKINIDIQPTYEISHLNEIMKYL